MICFPNLETFLASDNKINDLFELTYLSNLKYLEVQNNNIYDNENLDFLNMFESIEFINISKNPFIENLNKDLLNEYFYIQRNKENNEDSNRIEIGNRENFEEYNLNDIKENENLNKSIRLKANNSKIFICKI